jgi:hypothetical protein
MSMKTIGIGLAIFACITGVVAAIFWYRSSKVQANPIWPEGAFGLVEPGEQAASQDGWIAGMLQASSRAAKLNAKAALWTGGSVLLAAAASILSTL